MKDLIIVAGGILGAFSAVFCIVLVFTFLRALFFLAKRDFDAAKDAVRLKMSKKMWIAFFAGLFSLYAFGIGFSEEIGALFEKPKYTAYYSAFVEFTQNQGVHQEAIVQIERDSGYLIEAIYFDDGYIWLSEVSRSQHELLNEEISVQDPIFSDYDYDWVITLYQPATKDQIEQLALVEANKYNWAEITGLDYSVCYYCDRLTEYGQNVSFDFGDLFFCDWCIEDSKEELLKITVNGKRYYVGTYHAGSNSNRDDGSGNQPSGNTDSKTVYVTDYGTKYHNVGCSYLSDSKHAISKTDAISQGYSACSRCHP